MINSKIDKKQFTGGFAGIWCYDGNSQKLCLAIPYPDIKEYNVTLSYVTVQGVQTYRNGISYITANNELLVYCTDVTAIEYVERIGYAAITATPK